MPIFHKPIHDEIYEAMVTKLIGEMTGWSIAVSRATCCCWVPRFLFFPAIWGHVTLLSCYHAIMHIMA